ncbi:hypothetical protein NM208_g11574 [Fusarium decemcellulare]|uniref:Uncharacterized protein n=1 Tax=Fusarium decemcellulare TaxID=57161 RepID=A0ACC1RSD5_9HYPO|nr:hypothetical protein NM208_g11574 [Fusarium decemcellulare]
MKFICLLPLAAVAQAIKIGVFENQKNCGGQFATFDTPNAVYRNFNGANAYWNDRVSYVQIPPKVKYQFWDDFDCKGASLVTPASDGGVDANIPANHNDKISSFACFNA